MNSITIKAPAKINLFLEVLGERPDGYTEIRTLLQAVSLYDVITIERAPTGLTLSASDSAVPLDNSNTAARAWGVFCHAVGRELGAKIHLGKKIPIESGLGGGSSDAATVLMGLARLYDVELNRKKLEVLGAAVGSDVPFFFGTGSGLAEGRGERIIDVPLSLNYAILLVKPSYGMSSAEAYAAVRKDLTDVNMRINLKNYDWSMEPEKLCRVGNALERVFFRKYREARLIKEQLAEAGASYAALTGSGSAFFGIFDSIECARIAEAQFPKLWTSAVVPVRIRHLENMQEGLEGWNP